MDPTANQAQVDIANLVILLYDRCMSICQKTGKEQYDRAGATAAVNSMRERQPKFPVYKYICQHCKKWHLATVVKTTSQKRWHFRKCS